MKTQAQTQKGHAAVEAMHTARLQNDPKRFKAIANMNFKGITIAKW